jgi:hypothetical protein
MSVRSKARIAVAVVVAVLMLAEFSMFPYRGVPFRLDIPAADRWVAQQAKVLFRP